MEEQTRDTKKESKTTSIVVIAILITALLIGGGTYFWQQTKNQISLDELQTKKDDLEKQLATLSSEKNELQDQSKQLKSDVGELEMKILALQKENEVALKIASEKIPDSSYCDEEPTPTEIGRDIYPTNIGKYGYIGFLGELFTADDCSPERVAKIFGVNNGEYTLWPDIRIKKAPKEELLLLMQSIGFEPGSTCENLQNLKDCKHWTLRKAISLEEILKLKSYAKEIESCGCINCG